MSAALISESFHIIHKASTSTRLVDFSPLDLESSTVYTQVHTAYQYVAQIDESLRSISAPS